MRIRGQNTNAESVFLSCWISHDGAKYLKLIFNVHCWQVSHKSCKVIVFYHLSFSPFLWAGIFYRPADMLSCVRFYPRKATLSMDRVSFQQSQSEGDSLSVGPFFANRQKTPFENTRILSLMHRNGWMCGNPCARSRCPQIKRVNMLLNATKRAG